MPWASSGQAICDGVPQIGAWPRFQAPYPVVDGGRRQSPGDQAVFLVENGRVRGAGRILFLGLNGSALEAFERPDQQFRARVLVGSNLRFRL